MIFQQNNASIHVFNLSKTWFQRENIALLPWRAKSPDLNPIENVWGSLVREVYKDGKQYATVNELKHGILTAWQNLDVNYFIHLVNSMKQRVYNLIEAG
ncbi:transposase, partial [Enterobacter cloacae complex sp. 2DZ2F20B]|uniref:transposase n=1 Tax=Enterobacter cloacae complex sp. 2DZ2F20B TaxID=2511993 RepID=UPI0015E17F78